MRITSLRPLLSLVLATNFLTGEGIALALPGFLLIGLAIATLFVPGVRKMLAGLRAARVAGDTWRIG